MGGNTHQQSIGDDSEQAVDGIAGSHAGTQEPGGAHVDAGKPQAPAKPAPPPQAKPPAPVTGALGPASMARGACARRRSDLTCYAGYNGSLVRGGEIIGVVIGCGALSPTANQAA